MKRMAAKAMVAALALALGISLADAQQATSEEQHFTQQAAAINRQAISSPQELEAALHTISVQTGVPLATVQAQHRLYPNFGIAGLLVANVLAAETGNKHPLTFIEERAAGRSWSQIASEHNVPLNKLNVRLDNMEKALAPSQP